MALFVGIAALLFVLFLFLRWWSQPPHDVRVTAYNTHAAPDVRLIVTPRCIVFLDGSKITGMTGTCQAETLARALSPYFATLDSLHNAQKDIHILQCQVNGRCPDIKKWKVQ